MEETVCEICVHGYDSNSYVPRVLNCGHTICSKCIDQLIQSSRCCPKCRKTFSSNSSVDYPINYALIGLVDSLKNSTELKSCINLRVETLKRKYIAMETKFTENKATIENYLTLIAAGLESLQALANNDEEDSGTDISAINHTILTLNKQLDDIRNGSVLNYYKLKNSTTLNYRDFSDSCEFLFEIYNHVANGEQFYAVTKIETEVKFFHLSVWSNKLVVHAAGPPIEETQNIKTVWDIKNCLGPENHRAFLEVTCNDHGMRQTIVIKTTNSSLIPQFLKFCTGEIGPVYKGASFLQGSSSIAYLKSLLQVDKYLLNGNEESGNMEYISSLGVNCICSANEIVLTGSANGGIQIYQVSNSTNLAEVIGKIEEPLILAQKLTYGHSSKVVDSGIIVIL